MDAFEMEEKTPSQAPRTATVLVFLAASAMILAWLAVYPVTNALIAVDLIPAWSREIDPRPAWMLRAFIGMFFTFAGFGLAFRWLSNRQLRRIDAISND
ncbi:MAG TPA: hypothetical protein VHP11_01520 [Tepidisphaeraceae bacterium]|nr:hypothetical protein [Tepidisphaeraceae bacterium]